MLFAPHEIGCSTWTGDAGNFLFSLFFSLLLELNKILFEE